MGSMPESAARHPMAPSAWMRVALAIVALLATTLAMGLTRQHAEDAAYHEAVGAAASVATAAEEIAEVALGSDSTVLVGFLLVTTLLVLSMLLVGMRGFSFLRRWSRMASARIPVVRVHESHHPSSAPSLAILSISRT